MICFVGVGPGDPELITRKAERMIMQADAVCCTDSGTGNSAISAILEPLIVGKPCFPVVMPMKGNRENWERAHVQAAERLILLTNEYPVIAYPVLGDPGIYASCSYLIRLIRDRHPVEIIPGLTSICAAAARLGIPLCEQGESLSILDHFEEGSDLPEGNSVIMKCGKQIPALKEAAGNREIYCVRNLGMQSEWFGEIREMPEDHYSYFTTAIIKA